MRHGHTLLQWIVSLSLWLLLVGATTTAHAGDDTPRPIVKRIEVILSQQKLIAWADDRKAFEFLVTTGQAAQPTIPGEYEILDKDADAYSEGWLLKLPFWMGIYQFGDYENGFHALPTDDDGHEYWRDALGQYPVSHGCVVLAPEDAEALFEWAEVGTPVVIHE
ncbi:MAG: L,D-transpeptidase [Chloroflexota bacterium]